MGFKVAMRAGLDEWLARFKELGVRQSAMVEREYGAVLIFKDTDDIQFEMFIEADHPQTWLLAAEDQLRRLNEHVAAQRRALPTADSGRGLCL